MNAVLFNNCLKDEETFCISLFHCQFSFFLKKALDLLLNELRGKVAESWNNLITQSMPYAVSLIFFFIFG